MNKAEAIETCEAWFAHNERQRENSFEMQRLASLARTGPEGAKEARKKLANIDRAPVVFDGARLEPAVRFLVNAARTTEPQSPVEGEK